MTALNRDHCIRLVLGSEGGYTNDAADPGGPTNFGITIYDYRKYVKPDATAADVRAMTVEEAIAIYQAKYWAAQRCGDLMSGVDYAVFDYGVNSGIGRSSKVLRRVLGMSDVTSIVTEDVIIAVSEAKASTIINEICDERLNFLQSLRTWSVFGRGWGRRVVEVRAAALQLASGTPIVPAPSIVPAPGRAVDADENGRIRALQQELATAGFDPGAIDGDLGPKTVRAFQKAHSLAVDGIEGKITRPLLEAAIAAETPLVTG